MELLIAEDRVVSSSTLKRTIGMASLTLIVLCATFAIYRLSPSEARSAGAPNSEFASGRAMGRLKVIARTPHPIGSAEHSYVRDYILKELAGLGLNPEVQRSLVSKRRAGSYVTADVQNLMGKIPGADGKHGVLLACHYDSVVTGPGASDDGAGVAALLEVIRALKAGPPLKNDVLFLFTDGEEIGMLGAKAFMDEHPYAKDVAIALNFEARGTGGPSIMFETSEGNEWLVKEFAQAVRRPVANSLISDIYKFLPNATDMTVFKSGGLRGLNFAYINGLRSYHTSRDTYESIDERSLQHQGSYALALAKHFGDMSDWPEHVSDAVYFDILNSLLVSYSKRLVLPLMTLGLVLFIALIIYGIRIKRLTIAGIAFGIFCFFVNALSVGALMTVIWGAIQNTSSNPSSNLHNNLYTVGLILLTIALTGALLIWFRKKTKIENLVVGALFCWALLMVLICLGVPGGSYLVTWPLLLMVVAVGVVFISKEEMTSMRSAIILTLPSLAGALLIAPLFKVLIAGFGLQAVAILTIFSMTLFALCCAHLNLLLEIKKWALTIASGSSGLCFVVAALLTSGVSVDNPKFDHIFYALNADTGKAIWASSDQKTDEWTSQFFSPAERASMADHFPWGAGSFLKGDAPALPLPPPSVVVLDDSRKDGLRALRMRVTSSRQAPAIAIYWKGDLDLEALAVNGKPIAKESFEPSKNPARYRSFSYIGPAEGGIELNLEIRSSGPVELSIEDRTYGLPEIPGRSYKTRPDHIIAAPFQYSDCTVVTKSVKL
jgi:hypothetical protein